VREELHITSLVVHSTPKRMERVASVIAAMAGAQVHGTSPTGKLVVTLEASTADEILAKVASIQRTDGVLSAALVYQCADTLEAMNEVILDVDDQKGLH
jgi:nitrate reductase NapD